MTQRPVTQTLAARSSGGRIPVARVSFVESINTQTNGETLFIDAEKHDVFVWLTAAGTFEISPYALLDEPPVEVMPHGVRWFRRATEKQATEMDARAEQWLLQKAADGRVKGAE